jgi:hypothetical protein
MAHPLKNDGCKTPLQPCCNYRTRNYCNYAATGLQLPATTPQPSLFRARNYCNCPLRGGGLVAPLARIPKHPAKPPLTPAAPGRFRPAHRTTSIALTVRWPLRSEPCTLRS